MSTQSIREDVVELFNSYFSQFNADDWLRRWNPRPATLVHVISLWLDDDEAVIAVCLGDYRNYLIGVVGIIDAWTRNPEAMLGGELSEHVTRLSGEPDWMLDSILDPHRFEALRFRRLYPHADDSTR